MKSMSEILSGASYQPPLGKLNSWNKLGAKPDHLSLRLLRANKTGGVRRIAGVSFRGKTGNI